MCCLGFYSKACGTKPSQIRDMGTPDEIEGVIVPGLVTIESVGCDCNDCKNAEQYLSTNELCNNMVAINDDSDMKDHTRILKIHNGFKKLGVKCRFKNVPEEVAKKIAPKTRRKVLVK